jgi:hypothetical protein
MGMEPVRPLRDVFAGLAEQETGPEDAGSSIPDPRSFLAEYPDLPDELLVTAIGSYANTAPAEVAEHLARFVAAPDANPVDGLNLLASAPVGGWEEEVDLLDPNADANGGPDIDPDDTDLDEREPGLDLDHLDSADSLDLAETKQTEDRSEDVFEPGLGDRLGDGDQPDSFGPELGSVVLTDIPTAVDHPDPTMDDADGDYLDERIAGQPMDQSTDVDDLDDLQGFEEFDA